MAAKKHTCEYPECGAAFARKGHLDEHILHIHNKQALDTKYECPQCHRIYEYIKNCNKHIRNAHKSNDAAIELKNGSQKTKAATTPKRTTNAREKNATVKLNGLVKKPKLKKTIGKTSLPTASTTRKLSKRRFAIDDPFANSAPEEMEIEEMSSIENESSESTLKMTAETQEKTPSCTASTSSELSNQRIFIDDLLADSIAEEMEAEVMCPSGGTKESSESALKTTAERLLNRANCLIEELKEFANLLESTIDSGISTDGQNSSCSLKESKSLISETTAPVSPPQGQMNHETTLFSVASNMQVAAFETVISSQPEQTFSHSTNVGSFTVPEQSCVPVLGTVASNMQLSINEAPTQDQQYETFYMLPSLFINLMRLMDLSYGEDRSSNMAQLVSVASNLQVTTYNVEMSSQTEQTFSHSTNVGSLSTPEQSCAPVLGTATSNMQLANIEPQTPDQHQQTSYVSRPTTSNSSRKRKRIVYEDHETEIAKSKQQKLREEGRDLIRSALRGARILKLFERNEVTDIRVTKFME